jgi:predicted transposase YdaD
MAKYLLSKCKGLSSNPSTVERKGKERKKEGREGGRKEGKKEGRKEVLGFAQGFLKSVFL